MNIQTNDRLVRRGRFIATWGQRAGLALLVIGLIISFRTAGQLIITLVLLAVGFLLSQIGSAYSSRWLAGPRADEALNAALKGLDERYTLLHYLTPAHHLLVGPAGVWVLIPSKAGRGIRFDEGRNRWVQQGGSLLTRWFGRDGLGRPDIELASQVNRLAKHLNRRWQAEFDLELREALVFTNDNVELELDNSPVPALYKSKLKNFIRQQAKPKQLSAAQTEQVLSALLQ